MNTTTENFPLTIDKIVSNDDKDSNSPRNYYQTIMICSAVFCLLSIVALVVVCLLKRDSSEPTKTTSTTTGKHTDSADQDTRLQKDSVRKANQHYILIWGCEDKNQKVPSSKDHKDKDDQKIKETSNVKSISSPAVPVAQAPVPTSASLNQGNAQKKKMNHHDIDKQVSVGKSASNKVHDNGKKKINPGTPVR